MNKQLWYANSTGGVPYTYGESYKKEECGMCGGMKKIDIFPTVVDSMEVYLYVGRKDGTHICPECEGKGFTRNLV